MSKTVLFQTIQLSISTIFCLHTNVKTVLFQRIQFNWRTLFSSIWPIDRALSGATTPGQSGPGSDGIKVVIRFLQRSSITGVSPSNCLVSYTGHSWVGVGFLPLCRDTISVFCSPSRLGYIYIYIYMQYRLELPKLCYHPGWRLMRLGYRTCFHTLYDENK